MQIFSTADRYGAVAKSLHWLTVIFILLAWSSGQLQDEFPRGYWRATAMFAHASVGLLILCALALRLMWRTVDSRPVPVSTPLGRWGDLAGQSTHYVLYALLAAIPISGIVVLFARGAPLPFFGFYEIASPWVANRSFAKAVKSWHEILANMILILAGLHALAALAHGWLLKDQTLARMLPVRIR